MVWQEQLQTPLALREMVREATEALVRMDAERLEELARCCCDLNRDLHPARMQPIGADASVSLVPEPIAGIARFPAAASPSMPQEMELFRLVLGETRANLSVLSRLRVLRSYPGGQIPSS